MYTYIENSFHIKRFILRINTDGNCTGAEYSGKLYRGGIQTETVLGRNTDGNCIGAEYRGKLYRGGIQTETV